MWVDAVTQLAAIQKVPVADCAFLNLPGRFAEEFDQETDRWRRYLDWIDPDGNLVLLRDGFSYVLVVGDDSKVQSLKVGTGRRVGERIEITGGLDPKARVVASITSRISSLPLKRIEPPGFEMVSNTTSSAQHSSMPSTSFELYRST